MAHIDDRWKGARSGEWTARKGSGKRWRVRYADPEGHWRSKSFELKADAENFLAEVKSSMRQGTYIDPDAGKETLRKYAGSWQAGRTFAATTRERDASHLKVHILPKLGDKTLAELAQRPSLIQAWLAGIDLAPGSVHAILATLSGIFSAAVDDGLILRNPCKTKVVHAPAITERKVRPLTAPQVGLARAALPARYRALTDVGAGLGLRQGEAFALSLRTVEFLKGSVHVDLQVRIAGGKLCFAPPKRGRVRDIPLPEPVKLRLAEHLAAYPAIPVTLPWLEPGGKPRTERLLFTTSARNAIDRAYFHRLWRTAREAAGLADERASGFHALRHYYASVLLADGSDVRTVSEYLGHYDPALTLRVYAHVMPKAEGRALKAISDAFADQNPGRYGPDKGYADER